MRLWNYQLIPFLPDSQLIAQKREIDLIWKDIKQDKKTNHILINYIWEYENYKEKLYEYYLLLEKEFKERNFKFNDNSIGVYIERGIIRRLVNAEADINPFPEHHTFRYLEQNYFNLQEKFDRHQKDFHIDRYCDLTQFYYQQKELDKYKEGNIQNGR